MKPDGHFRMFAGAYIRGALYAVVAFLTSFIGVFEEMPPATLAALTTMGWAVAWAKVLLPTAVTMRAFFDGTLERIKYENEPDDPPAAPSVPPA